MNENKLRTSEGVTDYLPNEYAVKNEIESRVAAVFGGYGYSFVKSPAFEYAEVFEGSSDASAMYKFIDRDGSVLSLRPDITPPIARIAAANYSLDDAPLRFCYVENAFRRNENYQGKLREFTQAGVELLGVSSDDADAEVIAVAINSLIAAGLKDFRVDVGRVDFLKGVLEETELAQTESGAVMNFILNKDYAGVENFIADKKIKPGVREILSNLCLYIGDGSVIKKCAEAVSNARALEALAKLDNIRGILNGYGLSQYVSFDLSMLGMLEYYTGVIFRGYARGTGFSVIDGGRYDNLCAKFGKNFPAVGFAIRINNLIPAFASQNVPIETAKTDTLMVYTESGRDSALAVADELRSDGMLVENSLLGADLEKNIEYAKKKNINGIIYFKDAENAELISADGGSASTTRSELTEKRYAP